MLVSVFMVLMPEYNIAGFVLSDKVRGERHFHLGQGMSGKGRKTYDGEGKIALSCCR